MMKMNESIAEKKLRLIWKNKQQHAAKTLDIEIQKHGFAIEYEIAGYAANRALHQIVERSLENANKDGPANISIGRSDLQDVAKRFFSHFASDEICVFWLANYQDLGGIQVACHDLGDAVVKLLDLDGDTIYGKIRQECFLFDYCKDAGYSYFTYAVEGKVPRIDFE